MSPKPKSPDRGSADPKARQRGIALISAVMTIAIASAVAARLMGAAVDQQSRAFLFMESDKARLIALAAERLAVALLEDDAAPDGTDTLDEAWASERTLPIEGGRVVGRVVDLQGRFNLNNLWLGENFQTASYQQLERLFDAAGVTAGTAASVAEWQSEITPPVPGVTGDAPYASQSPAYRRSRLPLAGVSELRLIENIDAAAFRRLRGEVSALPKPTLINVNTAGPLVMRSLSPLITDAAAAELIERRKQEPFTDIEDFRTKLGEVAGLAAAAEIPYDRVGVSSEYFMLEAEATFGAGHAVLFSLIHRPAEGPAEVLIRSEAPL